MTKRITPVQQLHFNGKRFMSLTSQAQADGCDEGFFNANSDGVHLYDKNRVLKAYIVNNARQGQFVVTAHALPDGRARYLFGACSLTERWLGLDRIGYAAGIDAIKSMQIS